MNNEQLRIWCLEFVAKDRYNNPVFQMIEAEILYHWVKNGALPLKGSGSAEDYAKALVTHYVKELIDKGKDSEQTADSSNANIDNLPLLKSFIKQFLSKFRRE